MGEFLKRGVSQASYAPEGRKLEPSTEIGIVVPGFLIPARRHRPLPRISPIGPLAQAIADRSQLPTYTMNATGRDSLNDRAERLADSIVETPQTAGTTTVTLALQSHGSVFGDPLSEAFKERGINVRAIGLITPRIFNPMKRLPLTRAVFADMKRTVRDPDIPFLPIARYVGVTVPSFIGKFFKGELPQEIRECAVPKDRYDNIDAPVIALFAGNDPGRMF